MAIDQQRLQTDQSYRADLRNQGYFVGSEGGKVYAEPGGASSGGGGGGGGTPATSNSATLDAQFQKMLAALASGNREAFEFEKDKFNRAFAEGQRQFNLTQQQNLGTTLLDAATKIRGPKDYLQYQQLTRGGQNLMQQLFGNQAIGTTPNTGGAATIQSVLGDLGLAGTPSPAAVGDPQQQLLQRFGITAGQQLNPGQVNPARWDAIGQIGRDLTKNLAETVYGFDPTDFESMINATRPLGTAARQTGYSYRQPTGIY